MRGLTIALAIAATLLTTSVALAKGTVTVQQANGSVQTYPNSTLIVAGKTLRITTADKKGTLVITDAACMSIGKLLRCYPYAVVLHQNGVFPIAIRQGTIYLNTTGEAQQLSHSSVRVRGNGVVASLLSTHGTYVNVSGELDGRKK